MIKTNEVRVGNWVMGNAPYQLTLNQIITNDLYLRQGKKGYFDPIPLTEEILLKCGFHMYTDNEYYKDYNSVKTIKIDHKNDNHIYLESETKYGNDRMFLIECKHLHQLQTSILV